VFEPFFRSRQVAYELKRLQTVPEQQKWSIRYERKGCLICQTKEQIHVGCGMCQNCYQRTFAELSQIIAEGIKDQPARKARGLTRDEMLLPFNSPGDGIRQTWYERSSGKDQALYRRVATKLGLTRDYVRSVAVGRHHSESVLQALREESMCK
jgi:hypothetical protein